MELSESRRSGMSPSGDSRRSTTGPFCRFAVSSRSVSSAGCGRDSRLIRGFLSLGSDGSRPSLASRTRFPVSPGLEPTETGLPRLPDVGGGGVGSLVRSRSTRSSLWPAPATTAMLLAGFGGSVAVVVVDGAGPGRAVSPGSALRPFWPFWGAGRRPPRDAVWLGLLGADVVAC